MFEHNLVENARQVNDNHVDGFQSWSSGPGGVGTGVVRDVTLRGNVFRNWTDPTLPHLASMQGIGCFDGVYEGWVVENNVVLTDHWHGISFYGARDVRIVNNTVLDLTAAEPGPPWIMVTAMKEAHGGAASTGCLVRNNLATALSLDGAGAPVDADHNLVLPADPSAFFVDLAHQDLRLVGGTAAVDAGSPTLAPAADADGVARPAGAAVDLGAYEYAPGAARPAGGGAGAPPDVAHDWPVTLPSSSTAKGGCESAGAGGAAGAALALLWLLGRIRRAARATSARLAPSARGATP